MFTIEQATLMYWFVEYDAVQFVNINQEGLSHYTIQGLSHLQ
jgi:hypothetical protein